MEWGDWWKWNWYFPYYKIHDLSKFILSEILVNSWLQNLYLLDIFLQHWIPVSSCLLDKSNGNLTGVSSNIATPQILICLLNLYSPWAFTSHEEKLSSIYRSQGEKESYKHLKAKFQRLARRDKKAFLHDQCKEIEETNRMGKTRDFFKKMRDTKGTFHAKTGTIKDRNGMDLTV